MTKSTVTKKPSWVGTRRVPKPTVEEVFAKIVEILKPFNREQQTRILRAAAAFYGLKIEGLRS